MASLPQFERQRLAQRADAAEQRAPSCRRFPGSAARPATGVGPTITVLDFGSEYLPLPYAPRTLRRAGDWAYDPNSLVVLSERRQPAQALRDLALHRARASTSTRTSESSAQAVAGTPADAAVTAEFRADLPDDLIELTRQVTADADTVRPRRAAIQAYLRSGQFTYSTEPLPGSGYRGAGELPASGSPGLLRAVRRLRWR